jgi:hypothetical protein
MTTQRTRFLVEYIKSTEAVEPKIRVALQLPVFILVKLLLFAILGQPRVLWHLMTEAEIELLSKHIVRWRLVKKLRGVKRHAKTK